MIVFSRALAVAFLALSAVAFGQTPARAPKTPDAKTGKAWTTPRTPWGDPDLQGVFTNSNEIRDSSRAARTVCGQTSRRDYR